MLMTYPLSRRNSSISELIPHDKKKVIHRGDDGEVSRHSGTVGNTKFVFLMGSFPTVHVIERR